MEMDDKIRYGFKIINNRVVRYVGIKQRFVQEEKKKTLNENRNKGKYNETKQTMQRNRMKREKGKKSKLGTMFCFITVYTLRNKGTRLYFSLSPSWYH